jgi:DtxR family Mn-dependent transcriptional regulator
MPTSTVEDYLKRIYLAEQASPGVRVVTGRIAADLGVTPGTATTMIKALADSGLVEHEPYAGVRLTSSGRQLAAHVVRRHRLVELFLVEVMGLNWSEVHAEAEVLEHAVSDRLIERIDEMLGRPAVDPHGDPIPTRQGEIADVEGQESLAASPLGVPRFVARVTDQRADFLRLAERHGLKPGRRVVVLARDEVLDTIEIEPEDRESLRLGLRAASRILVTASEDA